MNVNNVIKALVIVVLFVGYSWLIMDLGKSQGKATSEVECGELLIESMQTLTRTQVNIGDNRINKLLLQPSLPTPTPKALPSPSPAPKKQDFQL